MGTAAGSVSRRVFVLGAAGALAACSSGGDEETAGAPGDRAEVSLGPAPTFTGELKPLVDQVAVPTNLPDTAPTIFRGVRLFDGEAVTEASDVILHGGLIAAVGTGLDEPEGADVVDGAGHTLIPAMIDAHTHTHALSLPQSARFGVLTELDMFIVPDLQELHDEESETGAPERADVFTSMSMATAPEGHGTQFRVPDFKTLTAASEVPAWVQARVDEGASYIKIVVESGGGFTALDQEIVVALVDEAHQHGLRAIVHAQAPADLRVALAAPVDGLSHIVWSAPMSPDVVERVAQMGTFLVTTSGIGQPTKHKSALDNDRVLDRVDSTMTSYFRRPTYASEERWEASLANLTALHDAGVPLLAGTDTGNPGTTAGAGMLVELENLVTAGMTPAEALRSATSLPAQSFGLSDRGRIAEGLRGDVALIAGDPTSQITDLQAISGVWKWGVPVDLSPPEDDPSRR